MWLIAITANRWDQSQLPVLIVSIQENGKYPNSLTLKQTIHHVRVCHYARVKREIRSREGSSFIKAGVKDLILSRSRGGSSFIKVG